MKLTIPTAEIFIPDGKPADEALARTTHLAIAAHQDDIEIMAYHGIVECFGRDDRWFTGLMVSNGAGSPRDGLYAAYTDEEMQKVRRTEQKKAAVVGEYGALAFLDFTSSQAKDPQNQAVVKDIEELFAACKPEVVYTHSLADKHDTHVAVALRTIQALRNLPAGDRPKALYGCEVWRDLDWMTDADKVGFDVSAHPNLAASLIGVFDSQICGGKRYDLATIGRRAANATYFASHGTDTVSSLSFGVDLTPLIVDESLDPAEFVLGFIERFRQEVATRLGALR